MKEGCFAWAATETQAVRAIRRYLIEGRGFDKRWVKAAGYWQRGAVGEHVVVDD
jgi:NADPH-dependent ferric siderophore reductase